MTTPHPRTRIRTASSADQLTVEYVPIENVTPYARNPRKNDGLPIAKVAASLREYGWRQPIVCDEAMVVIAGHTRLEAARSLGMTTVPVHIATGLTKTQVKAYRLADNRVGQEATWDDGLLALELADLTADDFDLALTGFDEDELTAVLNPASTVLDGADLDAVPDAPQVPITKMGDVIILGRHRLVCGDATDASAWDALLAGREAGIVWTDPPYGVSYQSDLSPQEAKRLHRRTDGKKVENDTLSDEDLVSFLRATLSLGWAHTRAGATWYVAAPAGPQLLAFARVLFDLEVWRQTLTWVKDQFAFGRSDYHYRHETIFYGWKEGAAHTWNGGRSQDTCLEIARPRVSKEHPTMKPVALIQRCIENSSNASDLVVDPFGGSGSTLLAAEACGRSAALIELSPAYCDVIVTRWETATGQTAVRP